MHSVHSKFSPFLSIDLCVYCYCCCCCLFNRFHMFHRMNIFIYLHWQYWPVLSKSIHSTTNRTQIPKSQWRYIIDFSIEFEINMIYYGVSFVHTDDHLYSIRFEKLFEIEWHVYNSRTFSTTISIFFILNSCFH